MDTYEQKGKDTYDAYLRIEIQIFTLAVLMSVKFELLGDIKTANVFIIQ